MTPAQDRGYWRRWGAVVRTVERETGVKWAKAEQDAERHQITLDATKGRTSAHKELRNNGEITALFRTLDFKADPTNLKKARAVANPEEAKEANDQRQAVFALSDKGLSTEEIEDILAPLCRREHVKSWTLLPSKVLHDVMHWKQFRPEEIARRRRPVALAIGPIDHTQTYYIRPARKFNPQSNPF